MIAAPLRLRPHRWWYLAVFTMTGLAAGLAIRQGTLPPAEIWPAVAVLTILTALGLGLRVEIGPRQYVAVATAPIFASVLLFGPSSAMLIAGLGSLLGQLARPFGTRWSMVFNSAILTLGAGSAGLVARAIAGSPEAAQASDGRFWVAALAAGLTLFLINTLAVAVSLDLQQRKQPLSSYLPDQRLKLAQTLALFSLGLIAALVGAGSLWAMGLLIVPMILVALSFRQVAVLRRQAWQTLERLADVVDRREPAMAGHSQRVADLVRATCRELGLASAVTDRISRAARIHDIGKLGLSGIIDDDAALAINDERGEQQRHPEIAAQIIGQIGEFRDGIENVRHHHEHWDGSGYPHGLAGEGIPLGARVIAICDAFDLAMIRAGGSSDASETLAWIAASRGIRFDPRVADAFLRTQGWTGTQDLSSLARAA